VTAVSKVLIVEDQALIAEYFRIVAEECGYDVCGIAATAQEAVDLVKEENPAVIFMDVRLNGERDGIEVAQEIQETHEVAVVYITASKEPETMKRMEQSNPAAVMIKPVMLQELKDVLSEVCPQQD
jgi:two-component system, response regulator PdtaR